MKAQREVLEELLDGLAELVRPLSDDALNWQPPADDTNSIAAMTRHVVGSLDNWLGRAIGEKVQRDREAEFRYEGGAAQLVDLIGRARSEAARRFAALEKMDSDKEIAVSRTIPQPHEARVSRLWCVEHALIHAGEHWGQVQLTKQLYEAYGPGHEPTI